MPSCDPRRADPRGSRTPLDLGYVAIVGSDLRPRWAASPAPCRGTIRRQWGGASYSGRSRRHTQIRVGSGVSNEAAAAAPVEAQSLGRLLIGSEFTEGIPR